MQRALRGLDISYPKAISQKQICCSNKQAQKQINVLQEFKKLKEQKTANRLPLIVSAKLLGLELKSKGAWTSAAADKALCVEFFGGSGANDSETLLIQIN